MEIFNFSIYSLLYSLSAVISVLVIILAFKNRDSGIGVYFSWLMLAVFAWSFLAIFEISAININHKIFFSELNYVGIVAIPVFLLLFSIYYNGFNELLKKKYIILLFVIPVTTIILAITNSYHGLIWQKVNTFLLADGKTYALVYEYGKWFWCVHLIYSYILIVLGIGLFFRAFFLSKKRYYRQSFIVLLGFFIPMFSSFIHVSGFSPVNGLDITIIAFSFSGILFFWALFYGKFLDIIPIARSLIIERMLDGVLVVDKKGQIIDCNPFAADIIGVEKKKIYFKNIKEIFPYWPEMEKIILSPDKMGVINIKERPLYLQVSVNFLYNNKRDIFAYLFVLQNITNQKKLEEILKEEKEQAQNYLNIAGVIFLVFDQNGNIKLINKKGLELLDYNNQDELLEKNWFDNFIPKEDRVKVKKVFSDIFSGKKEIFAQNENTVIDKKGRKKVILWNNVAIKDEMGKVVKVLSSGEDITDKYRIQEAMKIKHAQTRAVIESTIEGVLAVDKDRRVVLYNDNFLKLFRITKDIIKTKDDRELLKYVSPQIENFKDFEKKVGSLYKSSEKWFGLLNFKDGRIYEVFSSNFKGRDNALSRIWSFRDITNRKKMEKELRDNEKRYRYLAERFKLATESASIGVWEMDLDSSKFFWDDQMYKIYEVSKNSIGNDKSEWEKLIHPEDLDFVNLEFEKAIKFGYKLDSEFRIICPDGKIKYITTFASVIGDSKNKLNKIVGVNIDITKDKQVDMNKSEFIALASHQFRTPLTSMHWYTEILLSEDSGKLNDDQKKYLNEIYTSNMHMVNLVNSLLNISRVEMGTFVINTVPCDIIDISKKVIKNSEIIIKNKDIKLSSRFSNNIPKIKVDEKLLSLVLQNLLSNAVFYSENSGKVSFSVKMDESENNVIFKISDNGCGIPEKQQEKIFSKLFRADNVKQKNVNGVGLSLYLSKAIIDYAGGNIYFESKEGKGTSFFVSIPVLGMRSRKKGFKIV